MKYPISLADVFGRGNAYNPNVTPKAPAVQEPYDIETGNGDPYATIQAYEASIEAIKKKEAEKNDAEYRKSKIGITANMTNSRQRRPLDISLMLPPGDAIRHGILK